MRFWLGKKALRRLVSAMMILIIGSFIGCSSSSDDPVQTVQTTRDDKGVWFITGSADATYFNIFEAMGYAVAQDRLWQMELFRRSARGRLAEVLGSSQLNTDILLRTTGYSDAELTTAFNGMDAESQEVIRGYISGVNKRIAEIRKDLTLLPFEFVAVGQKSARSFIPADWTPEDVLAWTALMQRNFDPEATNKQQINNMALFSSLAAQYPADYQSMFSDLRWTSDPDALVYYEGEPATGAVLAGRPAIPGKTPDLSRVAAAIAERNDNMVASLQKINAFVKMGSYAWSVSGDRTASGHPIIYSGPQMGFSTPAICLEGSIRAGNLNISGMGLAGIPGIVIGRTPHHAWSMQVANAHTTDYYLESPASVSLHRTETIKVVGGADVVINIYRSAHGPVINPVPYDPDTYVPDPANPIISWKYAHWGYEFDTIGGFIDLATAKSMDEFGAGIQRVAVSQHFCYADKDGNIAYWMSGRDPVRPQGDYRFPQGFIPGMPVGEWDSAVLKPRSTHRNDSKGYYTGWNNLDSRNAESGFNSPSKQFGPFDRAQVLTDYFEANDDFTFEELRDLALNIASTDSFGLGGNPWPFVSDVFVSVVTSAGLTDGRAEALDLLAEWDGHFVDGGPANWAAGTDRADAWVLMDQWLREALRLTFADELGALYDSESRIILFNAFLHGLPELNTALVNQYDWFQNPSDPSAPQTADFIIVTALDNVLAALGSRPWGAGTRGEIEYKHDLIGVVHTMPFASRSTYAHCVEVGPNGPVRIESMFPLGESGDIRMNKDGTPAFNANFFTMTPVYDHFVYRPFPLFN